MTGSKKVAEYRDALRQGRHAAGTDGNAIKLGLEIQAAESARPGARKSPEPGDNAKPGPAKADTADDPRRNRPATRKTARARND